MIIIHKFDFIIQMALNNKYADQLLSSNKKEVMAVVTQFRKISEGLRKPHFGKIYKFDDHWRMFFHSDQHGIHFDKEESHVGGTLLLKYQQLPKNEDYTLIDRFIYKKKVCYVGRDCITEVPDSDDVEYDLIMSGQKKGDSVKSTSEAKARNERLSKMIHDKPFLVIIQTDEHIYIMGFYVLQSFKKHNNKTPFTHTFYFNKV